jgi:hypothetical protein
MVGFMMYSCFRGCPRTVQSAEIVALKVGLYGGDKRAASRDLELASRAPPRQFGPWR